MAYELPSGGTLDVNFMFTKLCVADLDKAARFYTALCGLIEMNRVEAEITGHRVSEIVYQPTYAGGPLFILAHFPGRAPPASDEVILGFSAKDVDAFLKRAVEAGGRILEPLKESGDGMAHAFVADPDGHRIQISRSLG
ncbi:VOC family protein [Sphingobium sp. Cam5-1]|uniref:VOC family protein n=1 Tax=Sphingobium sp. Cam5-1 TaxID=2789327 RepID=UPI0018AD0EC9|nr:VOC family protein [Sphingobium sp. Cam5-1]QPI74608.1 VOC family protein [Sphingobium sp. Cam5-1]